MAFAQIPLEQDVSIFETKKLDDSYKYGRLLSKIEKDEYLSMAHNDGELLHCGTHKGLLLSWDLSNVSHTGGSVKEVQRINLMKGNKAISPSCLDLDRDTFYVGDNDGGVSMFHRVSGKCLSYESEHKAKVANIKKINKNLFHTGYDGYLLVRDLESSRIKHSWIATKCPLSTMIAKDDSNIIVGSWDSGICQIDLRGKSATRFTCGNKSPIRTMTLHEEGNILVVGHGIGGLRSWDLRNTEKPLFDYGLGNGHKDVVNTILFQKDRFFTGADDHRVLMFDVNRPKCLDKLHGHSSGVIHLSFSGDLLVSANSKSFRKHRMTDITNAFNQAEELRHRKAQAEQEAAGEAAKKEETKGGKKKKGKR